MMMTHVVVSSPDLGSKLSNTMKSTLSPRRGARSTGGLSLPARGRNHSPSQRWLQRKVLWQQNLELTEPPSWGARLQSCLPRYLGTYLSRRQDLTVWVISPKGILREEIPKEVVLQDSLSEHISQDGIPHPNGKFPTISHPAVYLLVHSPKVTAKNPMRTIGWVSIPFCYAVDAMCLSPLHLCPTPSQRTAPSVLQRTSYQV